MSAPQPSQRAASTPESLAFLQARVAQFGLVAASISAGFLAYRVVAATALGGSFALQAELRQRSFVHHALAAAFLAAIWLVCRRGQWSRQVVVATETLGFVGSSLAYMAMGPDLPLPARPELIVLFAMSFALIARSAWVPSSAAHTLVLGALVGLPQLRMTWLLYSTDTATAFLASVRSFDDSVRPGQFALVMTLTAAAWWGAIVALAAAISQVIYGLRREVQLARRLGQYELEEKLGEGGMGVVYRARHAMLRRPTAVKLLPHERSSEADVRRFEREVQQTARLTHPNTVTVYDYGRTPEGVFYYAMELLDGADLERLVRSSGPLPPERVLHVLHGVAGALSEAHGIGLVHRDLKPSNVMLCRQGGHVDVPKVLDFGLVKELDDNGDAALTRDGAIAGTPHYIAPEGIRSTQQVDGRTDLYAVGGIGFFLLTGEVLFGGARIVEIYAAHLHTPPDAPSRRLGRPLPRDLEAIVLDCLAKDPAARPQSAVELAGRLAACEDFGAWTPDRAEAWWQAQGQQFTPPAPSTTEGDRSGRDSMATLTRAP